MIKANFFKNKNKFVTVEISGHARMAKHGEDLICAGASAIVFGILNSLDLNLVFVKIEENLILINVKNENDTKTQILLKALFISLKTLEEENTKYIKVLEKEKKWN